MSIQDNSQREKRRLYVKYEQDGRLFRPPEDSRFVMYLDIDVLLPEGVTLDQLFMSHVEGHMIANGMRPKAYQFSWSVSDPYAPDDVPVPTELRAVVPLNIHSDEGLLAWFNYPNTSRFGGVRPSEIWESGERGRQQVLELARQYVADRPLAAIGLRVIE